MRPYGWRVICCIIVVCSHYMPEACPYRLVAFSSALVWCPHQFSTDPIILCNHSLTILFTFPAPPQILCKFHEGGGFIVTMLYQTVLMVRNGRFFLLYWRKVVNFIPEFQKLLTNQPSYNEKINYLYSFCLYGCVWGASKRCGSAARHGIHC